jgi:kumamolisin
MTEGKFRSAIRYPRAAQPASLTPRQVAEAYNFPLHVDGTGYTGGIIELGGGYDASQVAEYFQQAGLPTPTFVSVNVAGGSNTPDGADGADGEVQLDMIVAGAIATAATFRVYFCPNDDNGIANGIDQAVADGCDGISISWGGPEDSWSKAALAATSASITAARAKGIPVFVAAGDSGSRDGEGHNVVDFPASAPDSIGCGGTRLTITSAGARDAEVVWDDSDTTSATGGGVSKVFAGRQVPDVAGNADPDTGYEILVDGEAVVVGGTSAVAPLYLGLHALLWQIAGGKPFDFLQLVTANPTSCFDVTQGDNGGYRAGPGRDETTGLGVVEGNVLESALDGSTTQPLPPTPTPAPTPTPVPPTDGGDAGIAGFPVKTVQAWLAHKHNHTAVETAAARSIISWADDNGIPLS